MNWLKSRSAAWQLIIIIITGLLYFMLITQFGKLSPCFVFGFLSIIIQNDLFIHLIPRFIYLSWSFLS